MKAKNPRALTEIRFCTLVEFKFSTPGLIVLVSSSDTEMGAEGNLACVEDRANKQIVGW